MKQKITLENLIEHYGEQVHFYCQVGVVVDCVGELTRGSITWHALKTADGILIGFSFGEFEVCADGIHIRIF